MNRSLVLGLIGLSVVVVLVLFVRRDVTTDVETPSSVSGFASAPAGSKPIDDRGPRSLALGQPAAKAGAEEDPESDDRADSGSTGGKASTSRADLDRYRQANRPPAGSGPRHGRDEADASAPGFEVKSQVAEPSSLGEKGESNTRRGNAASRAVVDEWAGVDVDGDPANVREPEEGEVLSLFEGDPIASQAEAAIAKDVALDENKAEFTEPDSEYAVPMAGKLTGDAGTLSFWVKPNGETSDVDNASLVQLRDQHEWNNRIQVWKDGGNVRMVFADGNGIETGATYGSDSWSADEWRLVTVTWGDQMNAMYVNGQLAGTAQYEGGFKILPKTMLHIGSNYSDTPASLNGSVSQFRVYNRALSPDEVAALPSQYPE